MDIVRSITSAPDHTAFKALDHDFVPLNPLLGGRIPLEVGCFVEVFKGFSKPVGSRIAPPGVEELSVCAREVRRLCRVDDLGEDDSVFEQLEMAVLL